MARKELYESKIPLEAEGLFAGVPPEKRRRVLSCLHARTIAFDAGDILTGPDLPQTGVRYLAEGDARILRHDVAGNRSILGSFSAGSAIGSGLAPLAFGAPDVDVVASGPCVAIDFRFTSDVESCPCCAKYLNLVKGNLLSSMARTNAQFLQRLHMLSCRSARQRILTYLEDEAKRAGARTFEIPYNRQELADYLCLERSALSRELGNMQRAGIISFRKNLFTLV